MSSNEEKRLPIAAASTGSERKATTSSTAAAATTTSSNAIVDLDHAHGDYSSFMGGSAAYGRTAFAQGGDQPAAFINFQDSETYRSVQVHNSALDQEGVRSVQGGLDNLHGYDSSFFGGGHGHADSSPFGIDSLSLDSLKPARMAAAAGGAAGTTASSSNKLDGLSQLRPSFAAVEIAATPERELIEPPHPPGGYLEPAYHFFSRTSPRAILDTIVAVLSTAGVDCTLKHEKYRISCALYSVGQRLPFSVRVFATEGFDRRYAVEFQRRAGDVLLFNDVYRSARRALEASGLVEGGARSSPPSSPIISIDTLPPLPPLDGIDAADQNRVTCKNLQNMASSKYVDVKCQAVAALCDMTNNITLAITSMMINEGIIDTLVAESRSDFEDVHRAAITAIANLTFRRKDVAEVVMAADGLKSVLKLASSQTLQVVRECARCLANLASCVGSRMDSDELRGVVRTLMCSEDSRARAHVHDLLATLRITAV